MNMYERFTDRARKVMQIANEEAQRYKQEYIRTEHILLGLIIEGQGVAANVLKNLGIDLSKILVELDKVTQMGPDSAMKGSLPQSLQAKKALEYSIDEARLLGHNYVGTEHLLLGLLRDDKSVASQVLINHGLHLGQVRKGIVNLIGPSEQSRALELMEEIDEMEKKLEGHPVIRALRTEIEKLHESKLAAVSEKNWELAARLRDQIEKLKKEIEVQKRKLTNPE
jgi:ATP-dependent Clp protease ATP-binding subunit ClpA